MAETKVRIKKASKKRRASKARTQGAALGSESGGLVQLVREVRGGFPSHRLVHFQKATGLPWDRVARFVGIPLRTLTRRQKEGRLRADESDRLLRAASVFDKAVALFEGNVDAARQWMQTPQRALDGEMPLDFADTDIGARYVEDVIARLEHGVFT